MWRSVLVLVALFGVSDGALAAYKCVDKTGKVVLQDVPCGPTQTETKLKVAPPTSFSGGTAAVQSPYANDIRRFAAQETAEKAELARQARVSEAILNKTATVGMTEAELTQSLGRPSRVNRSSSSPTEQWVFERGGGRSVYVYMEKGHVRSFQDFGDSR